MPGSEGIFENFESYGDVSEVNAKWKVSGSSAAASLVDRDGSKALKYYATAEFSLQANGYGLDEFDFTEINGFRMKLGLNYGSGVTEANVVVKIGSYLNCYTMTKKFVATNNATYMVCDFAGMKLADDGSSGALDKSKINFLQISVNGFTGAVDFWIDDLEFYKEQVGAKGAAFTSDFSDDNPQGWSASKSAPATFENGVATVTATQFQLKNPTPPNYRNCYAVRLKVKTNNVVSLQLRLLSSDVNVGIQTTIQYPGEGGEYILYFNNMTEKTPEKPNSSMELKTIYFYITYGSGGGSVEFESFELLIG